MPQYLYVLSETYKLEFYNYKIIKLIEEAEVYILSIIPAINANKLYLLWGIYALTRQIDMPKLEEHKKLIH